MSLKPFAFPCLSPHLDEGCVHPFMLLQNSSSLPLLLSSCCLCQSELLSRFNRVDSTWITLCPAKSSIVDYFCYRMYIISPREMSCLCSLNQCSYLLPQRTLQKLLLLLAKVQILKMLATVFLFSLLSSCDSSSFCDDSTTA